MGDCWYHDFSTGENGKAVDYLVKYLNYKPIDAILALTDENYIPSDNSKLLAGEGRRKRIEESEEERKDSGFPEAVEGKSPQMFAYLCNRGIPADVIKNLIKIGALYQSKDFNNIVFINRKMGFAEIRGTCTYRNSKYCRTIKNQEDGFWYFAIGKPEKAYICEGAIDAISLYLLLREKGNENNAAYISIAGADNQDPIDTIKKKIPVIIATDNDKAGNNCRKRNADCPTIVPLHKDWNEDLLALQEVVE